jgi:hypothetical protein
MSARPQAEDRDRDREGERDVNAAGAADPGVVLGRGEDEPGQATGQRTPHRREEANDGQDGRHPGDRCGQADSDRVDAAAGPAGERDEPVTKRGLL